MTNKVVVGLPIPGLFPEGGIAIKGRWVTRGRGQSIILVTYRVGLCGDPMSGVQARTRQNWGSSYRSEAMFHTRGLPWPGEF